MKKIRAALFDLDGTLLDTEAQYTRFWSAAGRRWAPQFPLLAQEIKGTTLTQILDRYFPCREVRDAVTEALDRFESGMTYALYPGAGDFVRELRANGVRTAIVTSSNRKKMEQMGRQLPAFSALFDRVLTSEDFAASKPHPDCYLRAAEALDCGVDECVVFEDAFSGLEAGRRAGIFTVGLPTTNSRESIRDKCDYVLEGFEGLTFEAFTGVISTMAEKLTNNNFRSLK